MQSLEINAEPRENVGKGASRRLRKTGKVPGIVYGTNQDAVMISLDQHTLGHQLDREAFYSSILTLNIGKKSSQVVLKDLQRHPYKKQILHVDFLRVDAKAEITMRVPLHFHNEDSCVGVKSGGGVVSHLMTDVEISCLPKDLPEYIEVDVAEMELGDTIHLVDLKMPDGVENYALTHGGDETQPVVSVNLPRAEEEEEDLGEEVETEVTEEAGADEDSEAASED